MCVGVGNGMRWASGDRPRRVVDRLDVVGGEKEGLRTTSRWKLVSFKETVKIWKGALLLVRGGEDVDRY